MTIMPMTAMAQTDITAEKQRIEALQAEAAAKAKAAKEAAEAAEAAAKAAQEAADAAAAEAARLAKASQESTTTTGWKVPVTEDSSTPQTTREVKESPNDEYKYAAYVGEGLVPLVNGKVQWTYDIDVPGKSADEIYQKTQEILTRLSQEENQLERSKVALVNPQEHNIIATMQEWLVFTTNILALDRTKFSYVLQAKCSDGRLHLILDHISYIYETQDETLNYKAEEWITDEYAVNKKHTRLFPISGKFRRKTIDRKNEIFRKIKAEIL